MESFVRTKNTYKTLLRWEVKKLLWEHILTKCFLFLWSASDSICTFEQSRFLIETVNLLFFIVLIIEE